MLLYECDKGQKNALGEKHTLYELRFGAEICFGRNLQVSSLIWEIARPNKTILIEVQLDIRTRLLVAFMPLC